MEHHDLLWVFNWLANFAHQLLLHNLFDDKIRVVNQIKKVNMTFTMTKNEFK